MFDELSGLIKVEWCEVKAYDEAAGEGAQCGAGQEPAQAVGAGQDERQQRGSLIFGDKAQQFQCFKGKLLRFVEDKYRMRRGGSGEFLQSGGKQLRGATPAET